MGEPPWRNGDDVIAHVEVREATMAGEEGASRGAHPARISVSHCKQRIANRSAGFDFCKDEKSPAPCNNIDLTARSAEAHRDNRKP